MALPVRVERGRVADPFEIVRHDFNQMLGRFFGAGLFGAPDDTGGLVFPADYGVDIREDRDHIYVEADLPGFRKDDIDISLHDNTLTIVAERREEVTVPGPGDGQRRQGQPGQQQGQQAQQAGGPAQAGQSAQAAPSPPGQQQARPGQQQQPSSADQSRQQQQQPGQQQSPQPSGQQQPPAAARPQGEYLLRERRVQRVVRSFTLPAEVDEQSVQATLEDGVLRITLNKRPQARTRRVEIA